MTYIPVAVRREVIERAESRCEYCLLPADAGFFTHEVDHIVAEKHGGLTQLENLAFTCWRCNRHKGSDLGSFDPETGLFTRLFNPRMQLWAEHFALEGEQMVGLTPEGRATINLLRLNSDERLAERRGSFGGVEGDE